MGRKSNKTDSPAPTAGLTDEHRATLQALYDALGAALGAAPASTEAPDLGGGDESDLGGDAGGDESDLGGDDLDLGGDEDVNEGPTLDDVKAVVKAVLAKKGEEKGREIAKKALAKYKADKLPALDEKHYAEFIALMKKYA